MINPIILSDASIGFTLFGAILLLGLFAAVLAKKTKLLPAIYGFILVGLFLKTSGIKLSAAAINVEAIFIDVCIGLILFELGKNFNFSWRTYDPWQLIGGVLASLLSFGCMTLVLMLFSFNDINALVIAAVTMSISPAVIFLIAKEVDNNGPVIRRAKGIVAINNVVSVLTFATVLPFLHYKNQSSLTTVWFQPSYYLFGSILLSLFAYLLTMISAFFLGKSKLYQFIMFIGVILISIGLCFIFNLSVIISLLFYGVFIKNLNFKYWILDIEFGYIEDLLFLMLLVITASNLNWQGINTLAIPVTALLLARFAGLFIPIFFCTLKSGFTKKQAALLGLSISPMAATSLWISKNTVSMYPGFGAQIYQTIIISMLLMYLISPIITFWAFKQANKENS